MSDNTQLLTVQILLSELKEISDWYVFGAILGVPAFMLKKIKNDEQKGVEKCKLEMLQYWLNTTLSASWEDIIRAVEQMDNLTLAARLKLKYLLSSKVSTSDIELAIEADVKVVRGIQDLESSFSAMLLEIATFLANCNMSKMQFFLNDLFDTDEFSTCDTIEKLLQQLRQGHVDTFNVYYLQHLIVRFHHSDAVVKKYEKKKDEFLEATTVKEFQQAIMSRAETFPPKGMAEITISIPAELSVAENNKRTLKDVERLARRVFEGCADNFISYKVKPGSILITWYVPESLSEKVEQFARKNAAVLREEGVEEVSIVGERRVFLSTKEEWLAANTPEKNALQAEMIAQLNSKLENAERNLEAANKSLSSKEAEQNERKKRVDDMETVLGYLIQLNEKSLEIATAGQKASIELSVSSQVAPSIPFLIDQLSCQITDSDCLDVECSITSTKSGIVTMSYTPTQRGAHKLRITMGDTDIPGSPFAVCVLPSLEMRDVPINTITGVKYPWGVAVSGNGEMVVSEYNGHRISVFSREGKKITSFGSQGSSKGQFNNPDGVAITTDHHILIVDRHNHRIQMFTMDGKFVRCVGKKGNGPVQFSRPSGIAVHPSGLVLIVDDQNCRIQVLNPDLSFSHMFGSKGSGPGEFDHPNDVACDSSGIVYVADFNNHRIQLFSANGKFISSFGSKGAQHGQFDRPCGICVDSTDTVYITDRNHRVSAFTTRGQFLRCFGQQESKEEVPSYLEGIAVDNTTGNICVCVTVNNSVLVY